MALVEETQPDHRLLKGSESSDLEILRKRAADILADLEGGRISEEDAVASLHSLYTGQSRVKALLAWLSGKKERGHAQKAQ